MQRFLGYQLLFHGLTRFASRQFRFLGRSCLARGFLARTFDACAQGRHQIDHIIRVLRLSDLNLKRIRASRPGGTWRDWPKRLIADCHRRETGHTYPGVYGRMIWDEPAPVNRRGVRTPISELSY